MLHSLALNEQVFILIKAVIVYIYVDRLKLRLSLKLLDHLNSIVLSGEATRILTEKTKQ